MPAMAQLNAADRAVLAEIQYEVMRKFMEERTQRTEVQVCTPVTHQRCTRRCFKRSGQAYPSSVEHSKESSNKNLLSSESTSLQLPDTKPMLTDQQFSRSRDSKKSFCYKCLPSSTESIVKARTACCCLELALSAALGVHAHPPVSICLELHWLELPHVCIAIRLRAPEHGVC